MNEHIILLPKRLNKNYISELIGKTNFIYSLEGANKPDYHFVIREILDMDLLGVLIVYKILEYSYKQGCFRKPTFNCIPKEVNKKFQQNIKKYGFGELISECFDNSEEAYKNLKTETIDGFLVAPMALSNNAQEAEHLVNATIREVKRYFRQENKQNALDACIMISEVLSELFGNFYAHANDKTNSIIVVRGNSHIIQITCADSGLGITETLRDVEKYKTKDEGYILEHALRKGVTSKPGTNHMGHGLWLINEIVNKNQGTLFIYTQSICYYTKYKKPIVVPRWKGTIVDIILNIDNPIY